MVAPKPRPAPARPVGRFRLAIDLPSTAILTLAAVGLAALVIFDLSPPLAFNDDWMYAWSVRQLVAGHGLHAFPESTALALVQVVWAALFSLGHPDQRLLRLSVVPLVLLTGWCSYRLARRLGADRFWSLVAGATLLAMPLFMANATSFMSDNVYVGLLMAIALTSVAWITGGRWRWLCVSLLVLAPLQRQVGIALVPAVILGLLLWKRPTWQRSDSLAVAAICTLPAAALLVAGRLVVSQPLYAGAPPVGLNVEHAIFPLPAMLGLALIPFLAALAFRPAAPGRESWWSVASAGLGIVGVIGCLVDLSQYGMTFPGNVLSPLGFTAILPGSKPLSFPGPVFRALEIAAVASFVVLFVLRRRWWTPRALGPDALVLVLISAFQFLPLMAIEWFVYDRYFLPVIAPLVPVIAAVAVRASHQGAARSWAAAAVAAGLTLYVIGEQDYLAWQAARDRAALLAYHTAPPSQVQAGFEANAVYVELPRYERTGRADLFAILGPAHPDITLLYAQAADPRPGVSYSSLAPGRIVLAHPSANR
jgi:Dolichyl-phosphate-mannose-protein mannosyltransferase